MVDSLPGGWLGVYQHTDWGAEMTKTFAADLNKISARLESLGAVVVMDDGFTYLDESKAPAALLSTYKSLVSYGYANGLI